MRDGASARALCCVIAAAGLILVACGGPAASPNASATALPTNPATATASATTEFAFSAGVTDPPPGFYRDAPTIVDFDRFVDGSPVPNRTQITDQYREKGVLFPGDGRAETVSSGVTNFGQDAVSQPNGLAVARETEMLIEFDGRCPTAVGVVFTDSAPDNPFTVTAIGPDGSEVASESIDTADSSANSADALENTFVGVRSHSGIVALRLSVSKLSGSGIHGWEVDDLSFGDIHPTLVCTALEADNTGTDQ